MYGRFRSSRAQTCACISVLAHRELNSLSLVVAHRGLRGETVSAFSPISNGVCRPEIVASGAVPMLFMFYIRPGRLSSSSNTVFQLGDGQLLDLICAICFQVVS